MCIFSQCATTAKAIGMFSQDFNHCFIGSCLCIFWNFHCIIFPIFQFSLYNIAFCLMYILRALVRMLVGERKRPWRANRMLICMCNSEKYQGKNRIFLKSMFLFILLLFCMICWGFLIQDSYVSICRNLIYFRYIMYVTENRILDFRQCSQIKRKFLDA